MTKPDTSPGPASPAPSIFVGVAGEIAAIIGDVATAKLMAARGGTEFVIPARAQGSLLASIIGEAAAEQLITGMGAGKLYLPSGQVRGAAGRRARAARLLRDGKSLMDVALETDVSLRTVSRQRARLDGQPGDAQLHLALDLD
jgi:hypothetical protein